MRFIAAALLCCVAASAAFALSPAARRALFSGPARISYVGNQSATSCTYTTSITSCAYTFGTAIKTGDSVAIAMYLPNSSDTTHYTISSVTDNAAGSPNTYTIQDQPLAWDGAGYGLDIAIMTGVRLVGNPTTFTLNFAGAEAGCGSCTEDGYLDEFSGATSVNATSACAASTGTNPSVSITTTAPATIDAIGALTDGPLPAPSGYTAGIQSGGTGTTSAYTAFGQQLPAGSHTVQWTDANSVANVTCAVAFK
jgi:hypothetical protein